MISEKNFQSNRYVIIRYLKNFYSQQTEGKVSLVLGGVILVALIGYGVYSLINLKQQNTNLAKTLETTQASLIDAQNQNSNLLEKVSVAQNTVNEFGNKVGELTGTVDTLTKLAGTDPELLKKYSKVYFLSENYVPKGLVDINSQYLLIPNKPLQVLKKVDEYLEQLIYISKANNLNLKVLSAFRSFGTQSTLKSSYKFTYGAGTANQFSAEQGYSEHQLGTTVDFTTPTIGNTLSGFSKTPEYKWLTDNAYRYGFVLSYPPNNAYYTYEPWHWRFVGVELATRLHEDKQYFYDLEQRQIDPYLVNIFN